MIGITQLGDDSARGFPFHHVGDEMTKTKLPWMQCDAMSTGSQVRQGGTVLHATHVHRTETAGGPTERW